MAQQNLTFKVNTTGIQDSITKMKSFKNTASQVASGVKNTMGLIGGSVVLSKSVGEIKKLINAADEIGDKARLMNVTAEAYQKINFAASRTGITIETVQTAFKKMTRNVYEAASGSKEMQASLASVGVSINDLKGKSPEEQFSLIAAALNNVSDYATKAALAGKIFGEKAGADLIPLIEDYKSLSAELEKMGGVISNSAIESAGRFNDSIENIDIAIKSMISNSGLVDWLAEIADKYDYLINYQAKMKSSASAAKVNYNQYEGWGLKSDVAEMFMGESSGTKIQTDAVSKEELAAMRAARDKRQQEKDSQAKQAALEARAKNSQPELEQLYLQEQQYNQLAQDAKMVKSYAMRDPSNMKLVNQASTLENEALAAQRKLYANELYETKAYQDAKAELEKAGAGKTLDLRKKTADEIASLNAKLRKLEQDSAFEDKLDREEKKIKKWQSSIDQTQKSIEKARNEVAKLGGTLEKGIMPASQEVKADKIDAEIRKKREIIASGKRAIFTTEEQARINDVEAQRKEALENQQKIKKIQSKIEGSRTQMSSSQKNRNVAAREAEITQISERIGVARDAAAQIDNIRKGNVPIIEALKAVNETLNKRLPEVA